MVGRHALRRVTLHVLDRAEVLARGEADILRRHVVLEVEPGAALAGHRPERGDRVGIVMGLGDLGFGGLEPQVRERLGRGIGALRKAFCGGKRAIGRARGGKGVFGRLPERTTGTSSPSTCRPNSRWRSRPPR